MRTVPKTTKVALSAVLIALGAILSIPGVGTFPVGPTRIYPFQHTINAISGILLGPLYSTFISFAIGVIRNEIGTGTLFAFPGGIPGAIVVSLLYRYVKKSDLVALTEPFGTAVGAFVSASFVAPLIGRFNAPFLGLTAQWQLFLIFFWMSSIPGAIIGYFIIVALRRRHVIERMPI